MQNVSYIILKTSILSMSSSGLVYTAITVLASSIRSTKYRFTSLVVIEAPIIATVVPPIIPVTHFSCSLINDRFIPDTMLDNAVNALA